MHRLQCFGTGVFAPATIKRFHLNVSSPGMLKTIQVLLFQKENSRLFICQTLL